LQGFDSKRWHAVTFHLDRDVLIERSGAKGEALAILRALPARMGPAASS
jgi:hypothetical protein